MSKHKFGTTSTSRLITCDKQLIWLFNEVLKYQDCTILCGYRDEAAQNKALAEKKSTVKWPNSKHNTLPSKAVDVAPYPIPENWTRPQFDYFAGCVMTVAQQLGIKIRWGGDWNQNGVLVEPSQKFDDLVHFELVE